MIYSPLRHFGIVMICQKIRPHNRNSGREADSMSLLCDFHERRNDGSVYAA